ncbi:MAG: cysteine hydrolase [Candidatus Tectomicrobia bacterium]|nr:cysteine hydrolase [Candidatus Tectomicrobia bacterium]
MDGRGGKLQDIELAPESTALVIVDMENEFCKPSGKKYIGPQAEGAIRGTAALLRRCRDAGAPVIYVRSVRLPDNPVFTRFGRDHYLIEGTSGPVIVPEVAPLPGEPVVDKHTHDCFYNTRMDALLASMGITPETHAIIVTGVVSTVCVYHAVLGFHVRHFRSVLPLDCTTGPEGAEAFILEQLGGPAYNYNVTLTTSDRLRLTPAGVRA